MLTSLAPAAAAAPSRTSHGAIASWWRGLRTPSRRISLALQGAGAHGAFTWGVLDALLADPRVQFEGLSGSSAGAMNAAILAHGWINDGRDGPRQVLGVNAKPVDHYARPRTDLPSSLRRPLHR